jgi:hypothetical protein
VSGVIGTAGTAAADEVVSSESVVVGSDEVGGSSADSVATGSNDAFIMTDGSALVEAVGT